MEVLIIVLIAFFFASVVMGALEAVVGLVIKLIVLAAGLAVRHPLVAVIGLALWLLDRVTIAWIMGGIVALGVFFVWRRRVEAQRQEAAMWRLIDAIIERLAVQLAASIPFFYHSPASSPAAAAAAAPAPAAPPVVWPAIKRWLGQNISRAGAWWRSLQSDHRTTIVVCTFAAMTVGTLIALTVLR